MIYPAAYARGGPAGAREVLNFAERSGCGMEPLRHTSGARFGAFEVWFDSGELHRAGLKIRVQQQPLKLLQILLEHRGEVVSREYLRNQLWANEVFGELGIQTTASVTASKLIEDYEKLPDFLAQLGFKSCTFSYPLTSLASSFIHGRSTCRSALSTSRC